jgi:spermidine synthase
VRDAQQARTAQHVLALLITALSGFAGLGYQMVWTRQCALWLGHEAPAVLAVIAAFFFGLSLGALLLGHPIERSRHPLHWYVASEAALAIWALLSAHFIEPVSAWLLERMGVAPPALLEWTLSFAGVLVLLLPATVAMGATLPAMQRCYARLLPQGSGVAALYAANTAGAVLGVLAVSFWSVPRLGLAHSLWLCAGLSLGCAVLWVSFGPADELPPAEGPALGQRLRRLSVCWRLALTGLLGIGFEVLVVRVLSQVAEDTVYTYAWLLAVYLLGSAAGAAWFRRLAPAAAPEARTDRLLLALALACLLGTAGLWGAATLQQALLARLGQTMSTAILVEALLALLAFTLATFVMGALFSHLAQEAVRGGSSLGLALGINTLGCALAPGLFGVLVLPALGPKTALLLVCAGYLLLGSRTMVRRLPAWGTAAAVMALALWAPPLAFVDLPPGGRLLHYEDGVMAAVSVVEDAGGIKRLRIDNRQQEGSSGTQRVDARQALLPLLLHPQPHTALFLGMGTGVTSAAAARDPALRVDVAELLPEVIRARRWFVPDEIPGLHVVASDARHFVRVGGTHYDVIVADNFHPARSGAGALYTVEHFRAIRARLADQGLFCQWLPLHQLDLLSLRSIVASFQTVYPQGWAMLANYGLDTPVIGLVARADDRGFDAAALHRRWGRAAPVYALEALGIEDEWALLGSFVAGPEALRRFAADAPLNTDDHPVVSYRAPRITYEPDSLPRERLNQLLGMWSLRPLPLLTTPHDPAIDVRLDRYWQARNRFIAAGQGVRATADPAALLEQVRAPLLEVLSLSPDFRPAYEPLLRLAAAVAPRDPALARQLLQDLMQRVPARGEAAQLLAQLNAG